MAEILARVSHVATRVAAAFAAAARTSAQRIRSAPAAFAVAALVVVLLACR